MRIAYNLSDAGHPHLLRSETLEASKQEENMFEVKETNRQGAKRSNRALGGIRIPYATECPVLRKDTKETFETRYGTFGAPCRRCSE